MTHDATPSGNARLYTTGLRHLTEEQNVIDYGAIIICRCGTATISIDFKEWQLHTGAVITLFPNDMVRLGTVSDDFAVEMLQYDSAMLREASLQLEQTVYSLLRKDRCRCDEPVVTEIIDCMFGLLRVYFRQRECICVDQLVLYQLKAFFLGFYDWMCRSGGKQQTDNNSRRVNELFNTFMEHLENDYKMSHDVAFYAKVLNITPKYLNTIVRRVTSHTPKAIIDQYVTLQLKLLLRTSDMSIKQISWDFHFSDVSFFCRYFKAHTGMTPQRFRKNIKAGLNAGGGC